MLHTFCSNPLVLVDRKSEYQWMKVSDWIKREQFVFTGNLEKVEKTYSEFQTKGLGIKREDSEYRLTSGCLHQSLSVIVTFDPSTTGGCWLTTDRGCEGESADIKLRHLSRLKSLHAEQPALVFHPYRQTRGGSVQADATASCWGWE